MMSLLHQQSDQLLYKTVISTWSHFVEVCLCHIVALCITLLQCVARCDTVILGYTHMRVRTHIHTHTHLVTHICGLTVSHLFRTVHLLQVFNSTCWLAMLATIHSCLL